MFSLSPEYFIFPRNSFCFPDKMFDFLETIFFFPEIFFLFPESCPFPQKSSSLSSLLPDPEFQFRPFTELGARRAQLLVGRGPIVFFSPLRTHIFLNLLFQLISLISCNNKLNTVQSKARLLAEALMWLEFCKALL